MRRRRLLAMGASAAGLSGCVGIGIDPPRSTPEAWAGKSTATPEPADRTPADDVGTRVGGSVHGRPYRLGDDLHLLERSGTNWLHAFLDVRKKLDDGVDPREDPDVLTLRAAKQAFGVDLYVSLQWNFVGIFGEQTTEHVPPSGSRRERALFDYAVELLRAIEVPIDLLALGNEPIWETMDDEVQGRNSPLMPFTRALKGHLVEHYEVGDPALVLGAFNRLYSDSVWRDHSPFYRSLLDFAREDDDIDGIDLHIHYDEPRQAERNLERARAVYPDGIVTATEFSPVWRYDDYKWDPIASFEGGGEFARRYGVAEDTTVTEYLEAAKEDRLSPQEIGDFYAAMPWYNVDFVETMYDLLARYDVRLGTFGFLVESDVRALDWTEGWAPFPINCLFQPALIATEDGANPHYLDDFRRRA